MQVGKGGQLFPSLSQCVQLPGMIHKHIVFTSVTMVLEFSLSIGIDGLLRKIAITDLFLMNG